MLGLLLLLLLFLHQDFPYLSAKTSEQLKWMKQIKVLWWFAASQFVGAKLVVWWYIGGFMVVCW